MTQVLNLLKLHPVIFDYLRRLGRDTSERLVTERKLRRLAPLPLIKQIAAARLSLPGFASFLAYRHTSTHLQQRMVEAKER